MPFTIQRPPGINVSVNNPNGIIYVIGDADTDGSIRIILDSEDIFCHIEARANGVWNDDSFRFRAGSVEIGRDLKLQAAANFIKTNNPSGFSIHDTALVPHIPFNGTGTLFPHTPIVDVEAENVIFSTAVSEISGTTISQTFPITSSQIISTITYEVGTVGATSEVQHTIYKGTDNTGDIINLIHLPASDFVADTQIIIDFGKVFGFSETHADIFVQFTTDTAFALKTDVSNNILITLSSQQLETRDLWYDDIIFDESLNLVLTSDLTPVYHNQFN